LPSRLRSRLTSFPTRRSSDLVNALASVCRYLDKLGITTVVFRDNSFNHQLIGYAIRVRRRLIAFVDRDNDRHVSSAGMEDCLFRSEEHTSELQSRENLVCRLL